MANITVVAANVRPLRGAIIRRAVAGVGGLTFGQAVYVSSYSGDLPVVLPADEAQLASSNAMGIVVAPSVALAGSSVAAGEQCDVVVLGPVTGYTDLTSGGTVWVSATAGAIANAVGATHSGVVGVAESPTVLFVRPGLFTVSA